jgi:hypothetical protein
MWLVGWGAALQSGLIPLPLSPYHPHQPLQSPKSGIWLPSISSISHHLADDRRKAVHTLRLAFQFTVSRHPHPREFRMLSRRRTCHHATLLLESGQESSEVLFQQETARKGASNENA